MTENEPDFDLGRGAIDLADAATVAELADHSPERLLSQVGRIVDELEATDDGDVEELLLIALLRITRHAPEECIPFVDNIVRYVDHDRSSVQQYAVATLAEVSETAPEAVSEYVPDMAAASNSEDDLTEFFATDYMANVAEFSPDVMNDRRDVLLRRLSSDDVDTGNAALAALESIAGTHPELAVEIRSVLKQELSHDAESRRLATAGVVREAIGASPQYLDALSEEVKSILNDRSPDVREIGIATFVDLWKQDSLRTISSDEFRESLERACEMNRMNTDNKTELLDAI